MRADSAYVLADTTQWIIGDERRMDDSTRDSGRGAMRPGYDMVRIPDLPREFERLVPPRIPGSLEPGTDSLARRNRSAIIVTEWGPYDWRSPLLWPIDSSRASPLKLAVLGPEGRWRVVGRHGIRMVSRDSGYVGVSAVDTIVVTPAPGQENDWELTLEHVPGALASGQPGKRFSYRRFEPAIDWSVRFFTWSDSAADPPKNAAAFATLLRSTPTVSRQAPRLDYLWYRPTIAGVPQDRFAIAASGTVTLAPGEYTLRTISDDGVRVWVDDRLVIDSWTPHESKVDAVALGGGRHAIRVQYYQLQGWTELRLEILRGRQRSDGSPGPH
jgi:hypothetical protein